jgi:hypothetical protein
MGQNEDSGRKSSLLRIKDIKTPLLKLNLILDIKNYENQKQKEYIDNYKPARRRPQIG